MKRMIISITLIIMILLTLASCNSAKSDNAIIQLWWYDYLNSDLHTQGVSNVIDKVQMYCESNNIKLEIVKYDINTLSYEDYVLKRNAAMARGNMITIDDARRLHDIAKQHVDYSRVENYNNIMDIYKDRYCIPIGVGYIVNGISNDILNYYGINTDKSLIFTEDYFEIKQEMKKKGAIFRPNELEYNQIIEYYLIKNGLRYIDGDSELLANKNKLKETMKKTVIEIYEDIKLYGKNLKSFDFISKVNKSDKEYIIFDENSGLDFGMHNQGYYMTDYTEFNLLNDEILNTTFILSSNISNTPCVYVYKKITNDKVYDVLNQLLDVSYYKAISTYREHMYSPTLNTKSVREFLDVDDNWEYNGTLLNGAKNGIAKNIKLVNYFNEIYDAIIKDKEKSKRLVSYYYSNPAYHGAVWREVSGIVQTLITDELDYTDKETDNIINKSIDEFIINFNVHYN